MRFVIVVCMFVVGCGGAQPPPTPATNDLEIGRSLVKEGLAEQAIPHLNKAIEADPKSVRGWQVRARAYTDLSQTSKAKSDIDAALKIDPNDEMTLETWGFHCLQRAIYDRDQKRRSALLKEAESYYLRVIEVNPKQMLHRRQLQNIRDMAK